MTLIPYRLCFPNEATAIQALSDYRVNDEDGNEVWHIASHEHNIVPVGDLYNNDATYDAEGNVLTPATKLEGWHINLKAKSLPVGAEAYVREPVNAKVKWSGELSKSSEELAEEQEPY